MAGRTLVHGRIDDRTGPPEGCRTNIIPIRGRALPHVAGNTGPDYCRSIIEGQQASGSTYSLDLTRFLPICPQEELSASQSLLSSAMGQPAIWLPADAFLLASNGQSSYLVHKVDEFYQQNRKYGELHPLIPLIQACTGTDPGAGHRIPRTAAGYFPKPGHGCD